MPGFNRKGPQNEGPMTGRGMGRCNSDKKEKLPEQEKTDEYSFMGRRLGIRRRKGTGFGFRRRSL